jgi:hypothetical protein
MATLADLTDKLKRMASVEDSEHIHDDTDLKECLDRALLQHNARLTYDSLPAREEEPFLILAWIGVCFIRASRAAKDGNVSGGSGFGQDRESIYSKNVRLARELKARYDMLCADLEIDTASDGVVVGTLTRADDFDNIVLPLSVAPQPPIVSLKLDPSNQSLTTGDYYTLSWDFKRFTNFREFRIYHLEGSNPVFEDWNFHSATGIPKVANNALLLNTYARQDVTKLKVQGLNKGAGITNRFLIVVRSLSDTYSYSNELILTGV